MTPDDLTRWERLGKWDVPTTEVVLSGAPHVLLFKSDFQDYREAMRAVLQLIAEVRRNQQDAERWRWLVATFSAAKGGASLTMNDSLGWYQAPEPGKECRIQWYPNTPVGFYVAEAATMNEAVDRAMQGGDE